MSTSWKDFVDAFRIGSETGNIEKLSNIKYLSNIKAKTLIVYGKNDLIVDPSKSIELAKKIYHSQVIGFPGGHGFWKENSHLVDNEVLDFLIN